MELAFSSQSIIVENGFQIIYEQINLYNQLFWLFELTK
jgi:hypothetical protein